MRNERKIACRGVVVDGDKVLAVRLSDYGGALPEAGTYWCMPGGKLEPGESLTENVRREMLEETGVEAEVGELLFVQQYIANGSEYVEFFFHITNTEDYKKADLTKGSHSAAEIAEIDFVDPKQVNKLMPAFFVTEDLAAAVENYKAPKFFTYL